MNEIVFHFTFQHFLAAFQFSEVQLKNPIKKFGKVMKIIFIKYLKVNTFIILYLSTNSQLNSHFYIDIPHFLC